MVDVMAPSEVETAGEVMEVERRIFCGLTGGMMEICGMRSKFVLRNLIGDFCAESGDYIWWFTGDT